MCFSATADLVGGVVLGGIGIEAVRHVRRRDGHLAIAALPLLLAAHQLDETFVWWGLQGHVSAQTGTIAMWIYLLFAFVLLPVYVPLAIIVLEPPGRRRNVMAGFAVLGLVVAAVLLTNMIQGPVTARLGHHHLSYGIGLPAGLLVTAAYVAATCGAMLFSGYRRLFLFGIVNLIAVGVLARVEANGFASLWCGWAAVTAAVIALYMRSDDENLTPTPALA